MSAPGASSQHNGASFQPSHSDGAQSNGAVQAAQSDTVAQSSGAETGSIDAIREGKQKAKEVMAAADGTPGSPGSQAPSAAATNGAPQLGRKRSRDGTLLPAAKSTSDADDAAHNEVLLDRYIQRDLLHNAAIVQSRNDYRSLSETKTTQRDLYTQETWQLRHTNPGKVFGYGYAGFGNRLTDGKSMIVFSDTRAPPKGRRCRQLHIPRKDNAQQAEQHEELVPVRLDVELDKLRLRDTFTWNLHEKLISPEMFADYLVEDLKIPPESAPEIVRQIRQEFREQIDNFYPHIIVDDGPVEPNRPYSEHKDDEMRIMIKINITIGRVTLLDQFEWDINNPLNSPEEFARQMARENALSGEFTTAIAHSIREQSQLYTKSLYLTNHAFDGRIVEDPDVRDAFLPGPLYTAFRPVQAQKDWMPFLYEMGDADFERTETSMMREHRAQKRQLNRRGGPALPDLKDRQRTVRSLFVHSVIPGAGLDWETTGIPKLRRGGRGGRRSGARTDGDADSDDLDSDDDSAPESPVPSMANIGTARTRGMRGAATVAQAAMRANYGRSQTPDSQIIGTPHDTRVSARRSMLRDESVAADEDSLVVRLRIGKAKLRAWVDNYERKKRAAQLPLSGYASLPQIATPVGSAARPSTVGAAVAAAAAQGTPSMRPRSLPPRGTPQPNANQRNSRHVQTTYDSQGRAAMDHWPLPDDSPPPPPPWLATALTTLRERHPDSDFEPVMKPYSVSAATGDTVRSHLEPGAPPPPGVRLLYLPRIRCNDCPGKLYTAAPGKVVDDFEVHLRNRLHREKVQSRRGGR